MLLFLELSEAKVPTSEATKKILPQVVDNTILGSERSEPLTSNGIGSTGRYYYVK